MTLGILLVLSSVRGAVVPAIAASLLSAGLVGAVATTSSAATAAAPTSSTSELTTAERRALHKKQTLRRYGVYPLPVSERQIKRYRLGKRLLKQLKQSKRFASRPKTRAVRRCESGGNYRINTGNGYYGAYQFNYGTWLGNGGGRYARYAHQAPAWAQDHIAFRTYSARGWQPWACA